jgi:uncharacterized protein YndB with AHSA1/START domain
LRTELILQKGYIKISRKLRLLAGRATKRFTFYIPFNDSIFVVQNKIIMEQNKTVITVSAKVNAPVQKVWDYWTKPEHITKWNAASPDWHTPRATNDLRTGGQFSCRMEARDGSMGFDFGGTYTEVRDQSYIEYNMGDGRNVKVNFTPSNGSTEVVESFEAEQTNSIEMQKTGWQAILDNFKNYTESGD